jgi:hypothetical protein
MGFRDTAIGEANTECEWSEKLFDEEEMLSVNPNT